MPLVYPAALTQGSTANATDVQGNFDAISTLLNTTGLSAAYLQSGIITNTYVSASAAIDFSKLAALSSANILVGNGSNVAVSVAVSGDITLSNAGVAAIATGVIVNADINASAAIAYSKLSLTGAILNADLAGSIAYSKLTLTNSIVAGDLASNAVTTAKITDANVTTAKINNAAVTADKLGTGAATSTVATTQATNSTSYTDLATAGPSVTVTVGANGLALVSVYCNCSIDVTNAAAQATVVVSGATTVAASDTNAVLYKSLGTNTQAFGVGSTFLLTGLTAGSTTFKLQYKTNTGNATFGPRQLAVVPL